MNCQLHKLNLTKLLLSKQFTSLINHVNPVYTTNLFSQICFVRKRNCCLNYVACQSGLRTPPDYAPQTFQKYQSVDTLCLILSNKGTLVKVRERLRFQLNGNKFNMFGVVLQVTVDNNHVQALKCCTWPRQMLNCTIGYCKQKYCHWTFCWYF